jgi:N-acetylmuramoyl-L-alanine amidase
MYSEMRALIIATVIVLLSSTVPSARENTDVTMRFSTDQDIIRIVLESDDRFISDASTIITHSSIKIEFPDRFILNRPDDFAFEIFKLGRLLTIYIDNVKDARAFKLFSPPRLVIDLQMDEEIVGIPLRPIPEEQEVRSIVINPGHGGYDFGIASGNVREKDVNLTIAKGLAAELLEKGEKASLVRDADQFIPLHNRVLNTKKESPDLFISIHSSLSDMFVIYLGTSDKLSSEIPDKLYALRGSQSRHIMNSRKLAENMQKAFKETFKKNVVIRELPLPVLNSIDAPAVMIEYPTLKLNTYDKHMIGEVNQSIIWAIEEYDQ